MSIVEQMNLPSQLARDLRHTAHEVLAAASEALKSGNLSVEQMTDVGCLCKDAEDIFDELRKEFKARRELAGKLIAAKLSIKNLQEGTSLTFVKSPLGRCEVFVNVSPVFPRKDTPEYASFIEFFGIPEGSKDYFSPSFTECSRLLTALAEEGKPLPPGVKTFTDMGGKFVRKP